MDMFEFLFLVQVFFLGWFCHSFYLAYKLRKIIKRIAEENDLTLEQINSIIDNTQQGDNKVKVVSAPILFTESAENTIMLYSKETGTFMCQAKTVEDLADNLYKFNKVKFALIQHGNEEFWFVEGKVKNDIKELE